MVKVFVFLVFFMAVFSCKPSSESHYGQDFIGTWEGQGIHKVKIEIKELITNGEKRENRFELTIIEKENDLPDNYILEGQYNYWLVTAKPEDNRHPFMEFIHKNSFKDTIPYFGFEQNKDVLIRKFKGLPNLKLNRIN